MTDLRQAAQQALEALRLAASSHDVMLLSDPPQEAWKARGVPRKLSEAITALEAALAEPQPEPVALTKPDSCTWWQVEFQPEPAGWFEGPYGKFRVNPLYKITGPPKTVAWRIALYTHPPQRQPQPEPVGTVGELFTNAAWARLDLRPNTKVYIAPPQRQPLTEDEILNAFEEPWGCLLVTAFTRGVRYAEKVHGIGGDK